MFINVLYIIYIYIYNILEKKKDLNIIISFRIYVYTILISIFFRVYFILERKLSDKITFEILIKMLTK